MLTGDQAATAVEILRHGAFLTTAAKDKVNTMTIGWGNVGIIWGKPIFTALIRPSRYTYQLIEASGEFTVSLPTGDMQPALSLCGSKSGRDMDKIAAAGLTTRPGKEVSVPIISGCGLHYECRVIYRQPMHPGGLPAELEQKMYPNQDYHVMYFGEIVAVYED